ncbi:molybdopterin-dependent oxidoreductase [Streptomyces thinghirensis]|nr:molybdopterin-dependent oxidoreductase [Streptomyces thinghirensis]
MTTVFDLLLAQYGVARPGVPGDWPASYEDADAPGTPAWQETHTSVPAAACVRIAREFARTAERSKGRCMIRMGAGTNHWFHSETIYRAFLALLQLTGCQGRNGGGWAHYVGQEKCRPVTGWASLAAASDWSRPLPPDDRHRVLVPPHRPVALRQVRRRRTGLPLGEGRLAGMTGADCLALSRAYGVDAVVPDLRPQPAGAGRDLRRPGGERGGRTAGWGHLRFACEDPDAPENWPRILTLWRANLLGSSAKGAEYFTKHLLGTHSSLRAEEAAPGERPRDVVWHDEAPEGKLDLLLSLDFRHTSSTLLSDVVLPAATWYEKHDLSSTDMHPYVHAFSPGRGPAVADADRLRHVQGAGGEAERAGRRSSRRAQGSGGGAAPARHPGRDRPAGRGRAGLAERGVRSGAGGRPCRTSSSWSGTTRRSARKFAALGPLVEAKGLPAKGITLKPDDEVDRLRRMNGAVRGGPADGRPALDTAVKAANTILSLSGTTNGRLAVQGFHTLEAKTGQRMAHLAAEHEGKRITYAAPRRRPCR